MESSSGQCRACSKQSKCVFPLSYTCSGYEDIDFTAMLISCTSIIIEPNDSLPTFICKSCISKLVSAYKFREQCEKSDLFLRISKIITQKNNSSAEEDVCAANISDQEVYIENEPDIKEEPDNFNEGDNFDSEAVSSNSKENETHNKVSVKNLFVILKSSENQNSIIKKENSGDNETVTTQKHKKRMKIFKCPECDKQFRSKHGLLYHSKYHLGIKTLICPVEKCKRKFFWKQSLDKHMQIHSTEKQYLCNLCGKAYNAYDSLWYHMKTHNNERPYLCIQCGKTYTQHCHLKVHMLAHSGEKPHVCSICNKGYAIKASLKKHQERYCGIGKCPRFRNRNYNL